MAKIPRCRETGSECDHIARGKTVEEVLEKARERGRTVHDMKDFPPDLPAKVRSLVRDEAA